MAELRRLLIAPDRLEHGGGALDLQPKEQHYLRRVLRLRPGDPCAVVDGVGHLWTAELIDGQRLAFPLGLDHPCQVTPPPAPRLGLAVVGVRRGMDALMRMACELGIDCIQPLTSEWRTPQADDRPERWQTIVDEAVEQCERLWTPALRPTMEVKAWWASMPDTSACAVATTRQEGISHLTEWLSGLDRTMGGEAPEQVWITIGPEAGWSVREQEEALGSGFSAVQLGASILRTSTAAVSAATLMTTWRDSRSS